MQITVMFTISEGTSETEEAWLAATAAERIGLALLEDFGPASNPDFGRQDGYEGPFITSPIRLVADRELATVSLDDVAVNR